MEDLHDDFLDVMGSVCTPVTVISALDGNRPHGTTVSAFASLSLNPPMVMIALDDRSDLLTLVRRTWRFGVNILSSRQSALASRFAEKGAEKFHGVPWEDADGLPKLGEATGWLACKCVSFVPGGDHAVVLGQVVEASGSTAEPLIYYRRVFGTHRSLA